MTRHQISFGWMLYLGIAPLCIADLARANGSLFSGTRTFVRASYSEPVARTPSTAMRTAKRDIIATKASVGSLFLDKPATGLFAPHSPSVSSRHAHAPRAQLVRLRRLIEMAESRRDGYDAVQFGAKIKPAKKPTRMTLGEIDVWTRATPGQPHAIGRYQFIPPTLRRLVKHLGLTPGTRFSEAIQDQLADVLLAEAGLESFQSGEMERETFMINLAKIWAGLPTPNGRSYYHGHAGNKASVSWELFDSEMARIFPDTAPTRVASR